MAGDDDAAPTVDEQTRDDLRRTLDLLMVQTLRESRLPAVSDLTAAPPPSPEVPPSSVPALTSAKRWSKFNRAIAIACITGTFGLLNAAIAGAFSLAHKEATTTQSAVVITNCAEQQQSVIDRVKNNPGFVPRYSGPSEDQCHLNDVVAQIPRLNGGGPGHH
jgi:hypothetical protein